MQEASDRKQMRNFKLLCEDTVEFIVELLSKDDAIRLLYGSLQDLGWKDGDVVNMRHSVKNTLD